MTSPDALRRGWEAVWRQLDEPWFHDPAFRAAVLEPIGPRIAQETWVLDAGCGEGRYLADLAERGARDLVGVDLALAPLVRARGLSRATVCQAALDRLPFRDGVFGLVSCVLALEHVADEHAVLAELGRVTRRGGRLVVVVPRSVSPAGLVLHVLAPLARKLGAGNCVLDRIPIHRSYTDRRLLALVAGSGWRLVGRQSVTAITFAAPHGLRALARVVASLPGWRRYLADERVLLLERE